MARPISRDYFVVVDEVEFRVDVESPIGDTLVPVEEDPDESLVLPLASMLDDLWLWVSVETVGDGAIGVVDWVSDELEDELCARAAPDIATPDIATPDIRVTAVVAARRVFIMSYAPWGIQVRAGSLAIHSVT